MRTLSQAIKDVLAADAGETKDVVIITIPEQVGAVTYPETTLYLANGEGVFINGVNYENKLRAISAIKFSLGKAPDNAEFSIENVSRSLGFTLTDFQRALDGSKVTIKRAFKVAGDVWEPDTMFNGYIRDVKVNQETINISCTSDMSRRSASVAGMTVTQRCLFKFNVNGSGVGPSCGWQASQPGNATSCDKVLDSANGCQAHGNQHRFGGLPAFTVVSGNGYGNFGTGWGGGVGGGWCVSINSLILMEVVDGVRGWMGVSGLKAGDFVVSISPEGHFVRTRVSNLQTRKVGKYLTLTTEKGYSIVCTPEHALMKDVRDAEGFPAEEFKVGDLVVVYDWSNHIHFKDAIVSVESSEEELEIVSIQLEHPYNLYVAGENFDGAIVSHNRKREPGEPIFEWPPLV